MADIFDEVEKKDIFDEIEQPQQNILQQLLGSFARTGQGIVRGAIEPPLKSLIARPMQSLESMVSGQPPVEYNYPFPEFLGGPINVKPIQNVQQGIGEAAQTIALGLSPALGSATYMGGRALEEGKTPMQVAGQGALGAILGVGFEKLSGRPLVIKTQKQLDNELRNETEKSLSKLGVKPSPIEAPTVTKVKGFFDKATDAIKSIYKAKDKLQYIDENGVTRTGLPKNPKEFAQAIEQTKKMVYDAYNEATKQTTGKGVTISLDDIANDVLESSLKPEITDLHPEIQEYALKLATALEKRGRYTPEEAQSFIKTANETLGNYYKTKHPDYVSKAYVESVAADRMRKSLDSVIEGATGIQYQTLKNQYGALSSIEKQVNRAAVVSGGKKFGLIDYFNVYNIGDITQGVLTGNLPQVAKGVGRGFITSGMKKIQSSEFMINSLFKKVSSAENYRNVNEVRSVLGMIMELKKRQTGNSQYR